MAESCARHTTVVHGGSTDALGRERAAAESTARAAAESTTRGARAADWPNRKKRPPTNLKNAPDLLRICERAALLITHRLGLESAPQSTDLGMETMQAQPPQALELFRREAALVFRAFQGDRLVRSLAVQPMYLGATDAAFAIPFQAGYRLCQRNRLAVFPRAGTTEHPTRDLCDRPWTAIEHRDNPHS